MLVCGGDHTIIKNGKNEIYVCGFNGYGQLGLGDKKHRNIFEKVEYEFGEIKKITCGGYHTIIQNEKNEVYVCGDNEYGQLGLGDLKYRDKFEKVKKNFGGIKNVACGKYHTVIQNIKNEVYVCGYNGWGQLGLGDNKYKKYINIFEKVEYEFGEIKNIACGGDHTIIQNEENEIYVCGKNIRSQLGLGDQNTRHKFEKAEYDVGKIKNIACGLYHTVIQNVKNEIYVCGDNVFGQLGLGDMKDRNKFEKVEKNFGEIKNIACGPNYTVTQNEKNETYACGNSGFGQLGLGDNKNKNKFEKVEYDFGKIKNIACGGYHTVIQNEQNEIYVCGYNESGQLGLGDNEDRKKFEKVNIDDIFEKIYNFEFQLNIEEIEL